MIAFSATLSTIAPLAGDLTPSLMFSADLTVVSGAPVNYVDFSGNLGGVSQYGKLKYGKIHYSRVDAFAPVFVADLDIVGQIFFAADLRPVITFAGALSFAVDLSSGDLSPQVAFSGTIGLQADLSGGIAPQIALEGSLSLDLLLQGDLPFQVDLACPGLISGPLWAGTEPCPSLPWTPTEPCPPSMWTPVPPPTFVPPSGGWTEPEKVDDLPVWGDAKN